MGTNYDHLITALFLDSSAADDKEGATLVFAFSKYSFLYI
jgi:hypothetical protein